jgi:hypothetical protein
MSEAKGRDTEMIEWFGGLPDPLQLAWASAWNGETNLTDDLVATLPADRQPPLIGAWVSLTENHGLEVDQFPAPWVISEELSSFLDSEYGEVYQLQEPGEQG